MKFTNYIQSLALSFIIGILITYAQPNAKVIGLKYTPREITTPGVKAELWKTPITINDFVDLHADNLLIIGENIKEKLTIQAKSTTSVALFTSSVFRKCYVNWGGKTAENAPYTLDTEISKFFVSEENLYSTKVKFKFTLKNDKGTIVWSDATIGEANVFGRSLSEDNYNEGFSDATQEAFTRLFENDGFVNAWAGKAPSVSTISRAIEPIAVNALKDQLLKLITEGFNEQAQLAYVKQRAIAAMLTADQMIEWKKAGIPQAVITEVIQIGNNAK